MSLPTGINHAHLGYGRQLANELLMNNKKKGHILVKTEGMKLKKRPEHSTQEARNS